MRFGTSSGPATARAPIDGASVRLGQLIRDGHVADQAELARLSHVSRARLTQFMNLLQIAPDIQEAVLHLPRTESGRDAVTERDLRPIAGMVSWNRQRRKWKQIQSRDSAQITRTHRG